MVNKKGKKKSGGKYTKSRKKKSYELAGQKRIVKLGEEKRKTKKIRGGNKKTFLLKGKFVNIKDKNKKVEIKNVLETPSNRFLARQNIITKGTVVETSLGRVKITNRPTQEGTINGIERPLDLLNSSKGKEVLVHLKGDKQFVGTLLAFDIHINLVLDNIKEMQNNEVKRNLGLTFLRGDTIIFISPASTALKKE